MTPLLIKLFQKLSNNSHLISAVHQEEAMGTEMPLEVEHKLSDVFGTSREIPLTYVERKDIDDRFLNDITRNKHVVVHGASKQGKTCLRKYHLQQDDYEVIQCTRDYSKQSLYEMLLKNAGIKCEVSEKSTLSGGRKMNATVAVSAAVPLVTKGQATGGLESHDSKETSTESKHFEIDPSDANDVVRVLKAANFKKYVVIEDFHYLDEEVQQSLAFDLKLFHETSSLVFIVVGVWLEANKLTLYNGDLSGRIATINADSWSAESLREVISAGSYLLNIEIEDSVRDLIVDGCLGNVGLLQEVCYRLCEMQNVWVTQKQRLKVGSEEDVRKMLRAVAEEQAARYRNFLSKFSEGLGSTQLHMYKWIGYAVVTSTTAELRNGLTAGAIFQKVRKHHPSTDTLQHNNVLQALECVGKVQFKHKLQPLIFDFSNARLFVVDANFLVFHQTHNAEELLVYLGFSPEESKALLAA
jgi:hypothetical protein